MFTVLQESDSCNETAIIHKSLTHTHTHTQSYTQEHTDEFLESCSALVQHLSLSDSLCVAVLLPSVSLFSAMTGQIDARLPQTVPPVFAPATPCTDLWASGRPYSGATRQGGKREAKGGSGTFKSIYS